MIKHPFGHAAEQESRQAAGAPCRTTPRARQPARFSRAAAASTWRRASAARSAFRLEADAITARRTVAGNSARDRGSTGSNTLTTVMRAPAGGSS
ncbi:MAG: hypothetical protein ACREKG_11810, partial [Candidatus Rokuibacteriota bacterium]